MQIGQDLSWDKFELYIAGTLLVGLTDWELPHLQNPWEWNQYAGSDPQSVGTGSADYTMSLTMYEGTWATLVNSFGGGDPKRIPPVKVIGFASTQDGKQYKLPVTVHAFNPGTISMSSGDTAATVEVSCAGIPGQITYVGATGLV